MELKNVDEANRMIETLLNLKREKVLTKQQALAAMEKVPYYDVVLQAAKSVG